MCNACFKKGDMDQSLSKNCTASITNVVPMMPPMEVNSAKKRRVSGERIKESNNQIESFEPHRNKVSLLRRRCNSSLVGSERKKPEIDIEIGNKIKTVNNVEIVMPEDLIPQEKTYLRINVEKKSNMPTSSKTGPFETIFLPYHGDNQVYTEIIHVKKKQDCSSQPNLNLSQNIDNSADLRKLHEKKIISNRSKLKHSFPQQTLRNDIKTVSQDHIYSCPPRAKFRSNNSKMRQEGDQLRRRLEELKERRKREQLKIVRLQMDLIELEKKMKENNKEEIVLPNLGRGNTPSGVNNKSNWLIREKEEYEKLLKDVREIKLKVLRERHNRELENIRRLKIQMTNLSKKMRENDEREIALTNFRETYNSATLRPDWMKKEEEEYEKLLQDVRKIKQSYQLNKKNEQNSNKSNSKKFEKVLSNDDCVLIETMQKKSKLEKRLQNGNSLMQKLETDLHMINDNNDYGEVVGEIDEDSIDVDMSKDVTLLTFNEELPDPGLLDS